MNGIIQGQAIVLGDDVNTDLLQPSRFFSLDTERRAAGVLPGLERARLDGAILLAGRNFGIGSSREAVIRGMLEAGVRAVAARSVSRIFLRNAINHGMPVLAGLSRTDFAQDGDALALDLTGPCVIHEASGRRESLAPLDPHLAAVLSAGGLARYMGWS